jgi:hypothetical protein
MLSTRALKLSCCEFTLEVGDSGQSIFATVAIHAPRISLPGKFSSRVKEHSQCM